MAKRRAAVFTASLERDAVHLLLSDPRFYTRIGHAIKPDALPTEHAQVTFEIAHAFAKEKPNAAISLSIVAQRLARRREEGRMTIEEVEDTFDWLEVVLSDAVHEKEGVIHELATELKRMHANAHVQKAMEVVAKHGSLREVADAIHQTEKLGLDEHRKSSAWDDDNEVNYEKQIIDRLLTGIDDLDEVMEGGLPRGCLTYALGNTGAGKSMFLSQIAAEALVQQRCPWIATFEVNDEKWKQRMQAAASNIPIRSIRDGELTDEDKAQIRGARHGGIAAIELFSASGTTPEDMWRAFDEANRKLEKQGSRHRFTVVVVDYADKLSWPSHIKANDSYNGYRYVYEALRAGAEERNVWVITASQSTRSDKKRAKGALLTLQDTADSMHKARIADVGITLNVTNDRESIRLFLEKNRDGEDHFTTDYLETGYAYGRLTRRPPPPEPDLPQGFTSQDLPF